MIEIYLLEQLEAFARCGTLSQAAEELHISQPALSRSMKKLEEEMGVPLFDRAKSKISLNETGQVAAGYARRVLEADREMIERTVAFERSRRTIAVGSCASLPVNELMPAFQECFWQMPPHCRFFILTGQQGSMWSQTAGLRCQLRMRRLTSPIIWPAWTLRRGGIGSCSRRFPGESLLILQ